MTMKTCVIFICVTIYITLTHGYCIDNWEVWKTIHGKSYSSAELESKGKATWENNVRIVKEHNRKPVVTFRMEVNHLADQVISRPSVKTEPMLSNTLLYERTNKAPDSWDWRTKGAVGPVRNQGQLGDALSVAATECVESYNIINGGELSSLSTAETHDCCVKEPIASPDIFSCIHRIGGLCTESAYPTSQGKCMNASCTSVAKITGGKLVPKGNEDALKEAVYKEPVMAVIDAGEVSFQLYRSGVYSEPKCSTTRLDHAVQIVGYGSMNGQDYWICKNSWGTAWGMNGYIYIARNKGNMCGIATMATYPV